MKIRVPPGQMIFDTFQAFGAEPVTTPANLIHELDQNRQGRRAGKSARRAGRVPHLRGGEICQHDQSYVVGLQPDGASRDLARPAAPTSGIPSPATSPNMSGSSASSRTASTPACATISRRPGSSSTRSTRRRSERGSPTSMRPGRTSSAPSAGRCWRRRSASWDNGRDPVGSAARGQKHDRARGQVP